MSLYNLNKSFKIIRDFLIRDCEPSSNPKTGLKLNNETAYYRCITDS